MHQNKLITLGEDPLLLDKFLYSQISSSTLGENPLLLDKFLYS